MDALPFKKVAGWLAITAAPIAFASLIVPLSAVSFDVESFENPTTFLESGLQGGQAWRTGMLLDVFGYYLMIVPMTLVLWIWLRSRAPLAALLATIGLLDYSLIGSIGAVTLATVIPGLIRDYANNLADQGTIRIVFDAFMNMVNGGLWNILE